MIKFLAASSLQQFIQPGADRRPSALRLLGKENEQYLGVQFSLRVRVIVLAATANMAMICNFVVMRLGYAIELRRTWVCARANTELKVTCGIIRINDTQR